MNSQQPLGRVWITGAVAVCMWALLVWEHTHGGVASHNILHRAGLPAISNWWGGVLLPVLTWVVLGRVQRRAVRPVGVSAGASGGSAQYPRAAILGLVGALAYGALMATSFSLGYSALTSSMFKGAFLLGLALPLYRGEYVLGFVLGMTFVFGAVLPTLAAGFVAAVSAVLYGYVRPTTMRLASRLTSPGASAAR